MNVEDRRYMERAIEFARRGLYSTKPNPAVGCIIVAHGDIIGEGFHHHAGGPHAEIEALRIAGDKAIGATVYVTLEPCAHHGRTPPCVEALIVSKVARVVYAAGDPNPLVDGAGAVRLKQAGIDVLGGVLEPAARAINRGFFKRQSSGRPYVRLKSAMSLDGKVALASGESQWITGPEARADVQRLRALSGAIVTGIGTVLSDDPSLNVRDTCFDIAGRQPSRIVLDSTLRFQTKQKMLQLAGDTYIFYRNASKTKIAELGAAGAHLERQAGDSDRIDLDTLLRRLAEMEINDILVEAGPTLSGRFIAEGWVDEQILYLAPALLGGDARDVFESLTVPTLAAAPRWHLEDIQRCGDDLRLTLTPDSKLIEC